MHQPLDWIFEHINVIGFVIIVYLVVFFVWALPRLIEAKKARIKILNTFAQMYAGDMKKIETRWPQRRQDSYQISFNYRNKQFIFSDILLLGLGNDGGSSHTMTLELLTGNNFSLICRQSAGRTFIGKIVDKFSIPKDCVEISRNALGNLLQEFRIYTNEKTKAINFLKNSLIQDTINYYKYKFWGTWFVPLEIRAGNIKLSSGSKRFDANSLYKEPSAISTHINNLEALNNAL